MAQVELCEVSAETVHQVAALSVLDEHKHLVATNAGSLTEALFAPEARYRAIFADGARQGLVMLYDETLRATPPAEPRIVVWRLMVDAGLRGQGIGRSALPQVIEHVRAKRVFTALGLSYVPGPRNPEPFYLGLGFRPTGRVDAGEVVLALPLGAGDT